MDTTREILTLQFGNYANFIGSHWWNIQESGFNYDQAALSSEINHDVLYREGMNLNRQTTYTPRLLLVDLDGSLKHMPLEGELYGNSVKRTSSANDLPTTLKKIKEDLEDKNNVEVVAEPEIPKTDFQKDLDLEDVDFVKKDYNLAESADSWVDFLYARYHPRSINIIKEYKHSTEKQTFDTYSSGVALWKTEQFEEDFCDKIRRYVEECDFLQGFQAIFDCFNGHSGLAVKCLEHLTEEYNKVNFAIPVFSPANVPFENADAAMSDTIRIVNSALAFQQLTEQSSLFVPLSTQERVWRQLGATRSIRSLQYQSENLYQTSGILAAYIDTISLRYRLKNAPNTNSLAGFCGDMTNYGRKMAAAALSMPFPMLSDEDLIDCLDKFEGSLFTQLTPNCNVGSNYVIQSLCVRGIPADRLKRPLEKANLQMRMAAYKCSSVSEMFQLYLQCVNHASMAHVSSIGSPMPTRTPFPNEMFEGTVGTTGFLTPLMPRATADKVTSVPVLATIQSSNDLSDTLETLHREAKRIKIGKLHRYAIAGLEEDDYVDALENLLLFKDNYEDNYEL